MNVRMGQTSKRRLMGMVALFVALGCGGLSAAERPPNIGTTLREIEQQRPAAPPKTKPSLQVEQPSRPALDAADGTTFRVTSVRISGATVFTDLELLPLVAGLAGRDVSLVDLEAAAGRLTQFYRSHGYPVARAYVPAQTIEGRGVEIAVLEGRYGALDVRNDSRLSDALVYDTLRVPSNDSVIETKPLDRDLLLLKDLAGVAIAATLTPGERVGTSNLLVDVTSASMFSGSLEADNFGNEYTGEWRYGGSAAAANLAGRGDLLSVRALISQDTDLWYGRAAYQLPVSGSGLRVGGALSHTYYALGGKFEALDADGEADIYTLFTQYPVIRSLRGNLDVQAAFNYFDLNDQIRVTNTDNPRRLRSYSLSVSGDLQDDLLGGAVNAFSVAVNTGNLQIDDDTAAVIDAATARTKGSFDTAIYSMLRLQKITDALQLYVAVQGQYASKNLDPSQKFVLGGPNAVRAYAQGDGVGDEGLLGTAEMRYSLPSLGWVDRAQVFAFWDAGRLRVNKDRYLPSQNYIDLYAAGIGINVDSFAGFTLRGSVAWRVGSEPAIDSTSSGSRGWIQIVKSF